MKKVFTPDGTFLGRALKLKLPGTALKSQHWAIFRG